ncbi:MULTISPECIES: DUF805 domain-containing protein [Aquincola]|uniref:DUF805 domain-containing protein n=1 Tax=Aquincola TaxID=391952 RepID=UPI0006985AB4|nr:MULTISPECIES: DUF805 domain-containing protein [Aquincola]MCR5866817.1 DUF805 domain-containing protein [Aquincola sp. J276]
MTTLEPTLPTPLRLGEEPMTPLQILFSLRGRVPRKVWWLYGVLAPIGMGALATVLLRIVGMGAQQTDELVNLLLLWPVVAVSVKRWHDRDKSGWWVFITLVPLIGWLWALIDNGLRRGTRGANRFGDDLTERF